MSPVQVSGSFWEFLGAFPLSIHHHCVALIHLLIAKKEAFWHTKKIAKYKVAKEAYVYLNDN